MTGEDIPRVVRVHDGDCYRAGLLVSEGPKYAGIIWIEETGLRVHKMPWVEVVKGGGRVKLTLSPVYYREKIYPVARAKRIMRRVGKVFGATKEARRLLRA